MTVAAWPGNLPEFVFAFQETLSDQIVESVIEYGGRTVRRRYTAMNRPIDAQITCTQTQLRAFEAFYRDTLGGVARFTWAHPITGAGATFRFTEPPPTISALGGDNYLVRLNLLQVAG